MISTRWIVFVAAGLALAATPASVIAAGRWGALGPEGADVGRIAVDPVDPLVLHASTRGPRLLYTSTDGGASWTPAGFGLEGIGGSVAVAPSDATRLYFVATMTDAPPRFFLSDDRGASFVEGGVLPDLSMHGLTVHPIDADTAFLFGQPSSFDSGEFGLLRTTDGGDSWFGFEFVDHSVVSLVLDPTDASRLFATSSRNHALHRSTDGGATWEDVSTGEIPPDQAPVTLAFAPTVPPTLHVGTAPWFDAAATFFSSTDGGETFAPGDTSAVTPNEFSIIDLVALPDTPTTVFALGFDIPGQLLRSTDSGATWEELDWALPFEPPIFEIAAVGNRLLAGAHELAFLTSDDLAASWTSHRTGFRSAQIGSVAAEPTTRTLWASTGRAVVRSTDGGDTWSEVGHQEPWLGALAAEPGDPSVLVGLADGIVRSTDGGATWTTVEPTPGDDWFLSLVRDSHDPQRLLAGREGGVVHRSTDGGASWSVVGTIAASDSAYLFADPSVAHRFFAIGNDDTHRSTDAGATWTPLSPQHLGTPLSFGSLVVDPRDGAVYGATFTDTYRSTDGGDTWAPTAAIGDGVTAWLADGTSLYAGTESSGVFSTDDGGATWTPLAGGQVLPPVGSLASLPGALYAGTSGSGVVRLTAADTLFCDGFESGDVSAWGPP